MNEPEEDVLGADVTVVEETSLFLGKNNHSASPVGKAFEQRDHPLWIGGYLAEVYRRSASAKGAPARPTSPISLGRTGRIQP